MKNNSNTLSSIIKEYYKPFFVVIFCLFVLYWLVFVLTPKSKISEVSQFEIKQLNTKIEEVQKKQDELQRDINRYELKIEETNNNIQKIKEIKIKIGNEYGKKINSVNNFTNAELTKFFTERYPENN